MGEETVFLDTIDGVEIEAALVRTGAPIVRATVIVAHPHPLHGGDRHNHVVRAFQRAAWEADCHSIAVNFRGVGMSGGAHDHGDAERLDLAAACELADLIEPDADIVMAGYSFGALVALNVTHPRIASWVAVAAPLSMSASVPTSARHHRPKSLWMCEHDQFTDPDGARNLTAEWINTTVHRIDGVDHFIAVGADWVAASALGQSLAG
jgi:alpha/beta superfamily hydrolase